MYQADGPIELKPVGETEFVNGTSAMSASGQYGKGRLCAGIVGHADLRRRRGGARAGVRWDQFRRSLATRSAIRTGALEYRYPAPENIAAGSEFGLQLGI